MNQEQILEILATAIAVLNPLITALATKAESRKAVKVVVCLGLSGIAAGLAVWGEVQSGTTDWVTLTLAAFGVATLAYRALDSGLTAATGDGLNEQTIVGPERGIG